MKERDPREQSRAAEPQTFPPEAPPAVAAGHDPAGQAGAFETVACLGPDCALEGRLRFRGWLRIEGSVVGEVIGENLVVGPTGQVKADLTVGHLVVEGTVEGTVRASEAVEIRQNGQLRGEVETPSLFIDRGVVFEGRCRVTDLRPGSRQDGS